MTTNESSGCYTDFRELQLRQPRSGFLAQRVLAAPCERSWEFLLMQWEACIGDRFLGDGSRARG